MIVCLRMTPAKIHFVRRDGRLLCKRVALPAHASLKSTRDRPAVTCLSCRAALDTWRRTGKLPGEK